MVIKLLTVLSDTVLPLFFWMFLMFGFDTPYIVIQTIASAVIHELGHVAFSTALSARHSMPKPHLLGLKISGKNLISYKGELLTLLGGPLINVLLFIFFITVCANSPYLHSFALVNLATALSNLIPVEGYDGYGILMSILKSKSNTEGEKVLRTASFVFCALMCLLSLYVLDKANGGYWFFAIFFISLTKNIASSVKYGFIEY